MLRGNHTARGGWQAVLGESVASEAGGRHRGGPGVCAPRGQDTGMWHWGPRRHAGMLWAPWRHSTHGGRATAVVMPTHRKKHQEVELG